MKAFPDPSNSPVHYTQSLTIVSAQLVTAADTNVGRWIRAFHNIVHLRVDTRGLDERQVSLVPLQGLSPTVRSLRVDSNSPRHSEVLGLLCSFPLLDDFTLDAYNGRNGVDEWDPPLTSPRLTGSLGLYIVTQGIGHISHLLLDLPNGLNFTKIASAYVYEEDLQTMTDLVSRRSGTIESLNVTDCLPGALPSAEAVFGPSLTATIGLFQSGFV